MFKLEEEIKKFRPSLEVEKIKDNDLEDLLDIIKSIAKNNQEKE